MEERKETTVKRKTTDDTGKDLGDRMKRGAEKIKEKGKAKYHDVKGDLK